MCKGLPNDNLPQCFSLSMAICTQKLNTILVNATNLWLFFNVISIKTIRLSSEIIILHEDFKHNIPIYSFFA